MKGESLRKKRQPKKEEEIASIISFNTISPSALTITTCALSDK